MDEEEEEEVGSSITGAAGVADAFNLGVKIRLLQSYRDSEETEEAEAGKRRSDWSEIR